MLFELHTGDLLFQTHDSYQHVALIVQRLQARIPWSMVERSDKRSYFEDKSARSEHVDGAGEGRVSVEETRETKVD